MKENSNKKLRVENRVGRWRLCNITFTDCDELLDFLINEMLQASDFYEENIINVVKNLEMRNFYTFKRLSNTVTSLKSMTYFN